MRKSKISSMTYRLGLLIERTKAKGKRDTSTKTKKSQISQMRSTFQGGRKAKFYDKSLIKRTPKTSNKRLKNVLLELKGTQMRKRKINHASFISNNAKTPINQTRRKGKSFAFVQPNSNKENLSLRYATESTTLQGSIISEVCFKFLTIQKNLKCKELVVSENRLKSIQKKQKLYHGSSFFSSRKQIFDSPSKSSGNFFVRLNKSSRKNSPHLDSSSNLSPIKQNTNTEYKKLPDIIGNYFESDRRYPSEITRQMRAILVHWIGEVAEHFQSKRRTVHLAVDYLDKYLCFSDLIIDRRDFQLIGICCFFVAAKFEVTLL